MTQQTGDYQPVVTDTARATPRLLDLFCGAGGATKGYQRAGFYVVGVDIEPQPNYCGDEFVQGDALDVLEHGAAGVFDAIHASPPCQHYARVTAWRGDRTDHPDLVDPTRQLLRATGLPWVIENVEEAGLDGFQLCGSSFGLKVKRHRRFECGGWDGPLFAPPCSGHAGLLPFMHKGERAYADALGCDWMSNREARQAIPPAYTEWIGSQLMASIEVAA